MEARTVQLPYDDQAELSLTRVGLMRAGVPARVLDTELPISKKRRQGPGQ